MLYVRKAETGELGDIMRIYRAAQDFMARTGNPNQWKHTHPALSLVKSDIENGTARVICDGTDGGRICGVFAMCEGADPTYSRTYENGQLTVTAVERIYKIVKYSSLLAQTTLDR